MTTDMKCELTSKLVDYIWYEVLRISHNHSFMHNDELKYIDESQFIYNTVYDIIDNYLED